MRRRARPRLLAFTAAACGLVAAGTAGAATTTTTTTTSSTVAPSTTAGASTTVGTAAPTTTTDVVAEATTTTSAAPSVTLTASPSEGPQGTVIHVEGTGCLATIEGPAWIVAQLHDDFHDADRSYWYMPTVPDPAADGSFAFDMTVPPEAPRGEYAIGVWCGVYDTATAAERLPFTVTGDPVTFAGLAVSPVTVRPGADVGFGGQHCTENGAGGGVVYVSVMTPPDYEGETLGVAFPVGADGAWFGVATIAPWTEPGTYEVRGSCSTRYSDYDLPTTQIVVAGEPVPPATAELPRTGTRTGTLATLGACCTIAGLLLITTTRRRRVAAV